MANQIRLTYGDFEKYLKIYEIAMKNGNFIIFFGQILAKTCSIMVSRGICMGMGRRGDFSKICSFFPQGICTFFVSCFYAGEKMLLFFDVIFFYKGIFQKTAKKAKPAFYMTSCAYFVGCI